MSASHVLPRAKSHCLSKERTVRQLLMLLTLWVFIPVGCVHFRTVPTDIAPTAATPQKYPAAMAISFTPRLMHCEVIRKPDTMYGGAHEYRYLWGPAVQAALTKSVKSAYTNVSMVEGPPRPGKFDRVLVFDLQKVDLIVEFVPGYLRQEARAQAAIHIVMEVFDGKSMKSLKKLPVTGRGSSVKDSSGFAAYASSQFSAAMENAIQQLSEIVSNLVITGAAEPK
jgi:hypothetical protein